MYYNYYRCPVVGISQDLLGKGKNKSKEKKNEKTSLLQFWSENSRIILMNKYCFSRLLIHFFSG